MTSDNTQAFFVATNGNDAWSGRLAAPNADGTDGPFATLERARDAMRATGVKTTYLRGGTHRLSRTLALNGADSGVRLLAYPGETPVLSGGERVGGFADLGSGLFAAAVASPTGLDLSIAGVRQKVAQTGDWNPGDPRSGWFALDQPASGASKRTLVYRAGDPVPATIQAGTRLQAFDTERLSDSIVTVVGIDPVSRTITFAQDVRYGLRSGGTFRLLNDDAFLRDAGEFAWRAEDGRLIVKPADPGALLSQGAVAARLGTLLSLDGASGATVQGLTFADGTWDGAAVTLRNGTGNTIAGNRFVNVGTALRLTGASGNTIEANRLEYLGAGGIELTYGSNGNRVAANSITDIGEVLKDVAAVSLYGASDNRIAGNDIRNSPRYGVSIKNWDAATVNTGNVVEYNRILNTMRETADGGAIEMLGRSNVDTRTVIQGNWIEGVGGLATAEGSGAWLDRQKSFGVYLDDQTNGVTVRDNFIRDTGWASVFVHGGDANRVENNVAVVANGRERFIRLEWVPKAGDIGLLRDNVVTRNVVSSANGLDYWEFWSPGSYTVSGNLVQGARGRSGDVQGDPAFANPGGGDFRFLPGSAAFALGIHDLDWARMGFAQPTVPPIPLPPATPLVGTPVTPVSPVTPGVAPTPGTTTVPGPAAPTGATLPAGFDPLAYVASYPDLATAFGTDQGAAAQHYLTAGQREGRGVTFDPLAYTASHTDLAAAFGTNRQAASIHYITAGRAEGRGVTFDPLAYVASHADLSAAFGTNRDAASAHYITAGRIEGRGVTFDPLAYAASYTDLALAFGTSRDAASAHYITAGRAEGRSVSFDPLAYAAANPDLVLAFGIDRARATAHYLGQGVREGRNTRFDAASYLAANPDVARAFGGDAARATEHYALNGRREGRPLAPASASPLAAMEPARFGGAGLLAGAG